MALRRSFAALSLGSGSPVTAACCRASTSTAAILPQASFSHQQSSSFHSSAVAHEKKRKMVARLKKKANIARREQARQQLAATAPDTVRGYGPNKQHVWYDSELRKIMLFPDEVYDGKAGERGPLEPLDNPRDEILGPKGIKSDDILSNKGSESASSPSYYNFALSNEDTKLLLESLPEADKTLATANNSPSLRDAALKNLDQAESHKVEATRRVIDLSNANARGVRFENTRRIIRRFGQGEGSGRCEVQAALLTMRIHTLADHLQKMPRDVHSKRHLTRHVMDRARILKYLKRLDLARYVQCLEDIGVEARAVEGSVQVKL